MRYMSDLCGEKTKIGIGLLAAVVFLLTGCAVPALTDMETELFTQEQETFQSSYMGAYYEFLQACILNSSTPIGISRGIPAEIWNPRFGLAFIDGDDIPELLVFEDDCHAAGVEIYTYNRDQVVELGFYGSFGTMQYVEKEGLIFDHYMGQGEAHTYFFQMEDGKATQISHVHSWPDYSQEEYAELYEIDGFSVSEEEFSAKWEELYGSWEYVLIGYEDGIPLEEETLLTALEQAIEKLSLEDASE